ncbi:MAG: hypothetical protein Kow0090_10910 [Myxococcota bacterium]
MSTKKSGKGKKAQIHIIRSVSEMQEYALKARAGGQEIGFVPTMGALHDGHLSLVELAKEKMPRDIIVVSIFVNPTQFGPTEDFASYPKDAAGDIEKLRGAGVDVIFIPTVEEMYPPGFQTRVEVTQLTRGLCGESRPGHFHGVTLVVTKLFNIVQPSRAYFGMKDYQQFVVIKRLVSDLNMPIEIIAGRTLREKDGLAMSSRNAYLDTNQRKAATCLYRGLMRAREALKNGERDAAEIIDAARHPIWQESDARIEYIQVVHPETLKELDWVEKEAMLMMAVRIGGTRLIDNMLLSAKTRVSPPVTEELEKKPKIVPIIRYGSPLVIEPTRYVPRTQKQVKAKKAAKAALAAKNKKLESKKDKKKNLPSKKPVKKAVKKPETAKPTKKSAPPKSPAKKRR